MDLLYAHYNCISIIDVSLKKKILKNVNCIETKGSHFLEKTSYTDLKTKYIKVCLS